MCGTCGCGQPDHHHAHDGPLAAAEVKRIAVERDLLSHNDAHAESNRTWLAERRATALNLMSSPGAGKTALLVRTLGDLKGRYPLAVVEGDQQTDLDAERIRATGVAAVQVNTGKSCHLDGHMVGHALHDLDPEPGALVFVENVGNLICPSAFDLGEAARAVLVSVTEGDDKPLKYPDMISVADLLVITKTDLLPHVDFDPGACIDRARRIRPGLEAICLSSVSGDGMDDWYEWINRQVLP